MSAPLDSPRTGFFGAHRPANHPRMHALGKPYSRPASYQAPSPADHLLGGAGAGAGGEQDRTSPTKTAPSTRPTQALQALPKSASARSLGMTRSGSESSIFSLATVKSLFTRPLGWLATPSRARARDDEVEWNGEGSSTGAGAGAGSGTASRGTLRKRDSGREGEPASPTDQAGRGTKKLRRRSPSPVLGLNGHGPDNDHEMDGAYEPDRMSITGRAITGSMLPPLQPDFKLSRHRQGSSRPQAMPNYSRPLPSSQSMSYLDPPGALLSPARNTRGALKRSGEVDLASLAGAGGEEETDVDEDEEDQTKWSPWKERYSGRTRASLTPARQTPSRDFYANDFANTSGSPFRAPYSPSAARNVSGTGSLTRSATTSRLRREGTVGSDVSMGERGSARGASLRPSNTMLFGGVREDEEMSLDGDRGHRENSILGHYRNDAGREREPGSPSARAATSRLSLAPSTSMLPIRRGQLVWDGKGGFVREHDLQDEPARPVHQNEAERILFGLQSSRRTPLDEARGSALAQPSVSMADLIGSSSRHLRKAVAVPLATSQADESARQRREKERLGEDFNVMISPYGRRKVVQTEERQRRKQEREESESRMDEDFQPSPSSQPTVSVAEEPASVRRSTRSRSHRSVSPAPVSAPTDTPRRSSRNKKREGSVEEPTPKATRTRRGRSKQAEEEDAPAAAPPAQRRRTRRGTSESAGSPPPQHKASAAPAVPTITETAPSPTSRPASSGTYQVRDESDGYRERSSLRAKTSHSHRKHESSANTRANSPSSGRFSAREEDLPDMDELESAKIQLPSFSGVTFGNFAPPPAPAAPVQVAPPKPANSTSTSTSTAGSLGVPSSHPARPSPLSRLNSTRPRSSSPLASSSVVAEPDSPPKDSTQNKTKDKAPEAKQDATGFFTFSTSASASGTSTPSAPPPLFGGLGEKKGAGTGLGLGKPSGPASTSASATGTGSGGVPVFFGKKAEGTTPPESTTPKHPPPSSGFSFGLSGSSAPAIPQLALPKSSTLPAGGSVFGGQALDVEAIKSGATTPTATSAPPPSAGGLGNAVSFAFGAGAEGKKDEKTKSTNGFSFGDKPAATPSFPAFGSAGSASPTSAEASKSAPAPATAGAPKSTFSFGQPAAPPASGGEAPKPTFSFGSTATKTVANSGSGEAPKSFTFGSAASAAPSAPASAPAPFSGFGAATASTPAPAGAASAFPAFGAKPAEPAPTPSFGGFGAPKPAEAKPADGDKPASTFTFGSTPAKPAATTNGSAPAFTFGSSASTAAPSNAFGSTPANGTSTAGAPAFGAPSSTPAFGAPAPTSSAPSSGTAPGFTFGSTPSNATPTSAPFTFGSVNSSNDGKTATAPAPAFGTPQPPPTPSFGGFGSSAPSTPTLGSNQPGQQAQGFNFNAPSNGSGLGTGAGAGAGAFGAPAPASASSTTPGYGSGAPASSTPGFGAPASNGFGTPQGGTPGFTFGAPGAAGTGSSGAGASTPFSFGAPNNSAPPTTPGAQGNAAFTFGTPASAAGSQPFQFGQSQPPTPSAGGPSASFQFGAPANGSGAGSGFGSGPGSGSGAAPQQQQGVRFGSPAAGADLGGAAAGGFHMGAAPASPSGRQIKPLKKSARMR